MRHTTFRFALDPSPAQAAMFARHAGASRFAYNQCLGNVFNTWKRSEAAGRILIAAHDGSITKEVTGLAWRHEVSAQVFEEAAVDLSRALVAYEQSRTGKRKGRRVGFPKRKRKGRCRESFRLRNKQGKSGSSCIRVGEDHPRSVTLPRIGIVRVHDDTRRLRRLLRPVMHTDLESGEPVVRPRAKVQFATVSRHGVRWYVSLNVQAPDFHPQRRHPPRQADDHIGFVGVDRGLSAFAVVATPSGAEVGRVESPKPLQRNIIGLRRRSRVASRNQARSRNRARAVRRLSRRYARIADARRSFLHEVSNKLVKTHDRLCVEDLAVSNLARNKHLARAIGDAAWTEFARQLDYKAAWFGAEMVICDRWFPSTRTCSRCGRGRPRMRLGERIFSCDGCGLVMDRDCNAAANLAAWAEAASRAAARAPDRQAGGRVTNAPGGEGTGHRRGDGGTGPCERGTDVHAL